MSVDHTYSIQILANWALFLANKSTIATSSRNFPGYRHKYPSMKYREEEDEEKEELMGVRSDEWRECETCDMHVPKASGHCGHCRRYIYYVNDI